MRERKPARGSDGAISPHKRRRLRLGRVLILMGVAVWGVWLAAELAGSEPAPGDYLPFHLAGVIPGALLVRWDWLTALFRRR